MEVQRPYESIPAYKKLPSDSTYREDLLYLKHDDESESQVNFDVKKC